MDYLEFFELREDPFRLIPDPHYFYPSQVHKEALQSLHYMVAHKEGFFLCTGEPGTGKTTLLKEFLNSPTLKECCDIAVILTPRLSPEEFLVIMLEDLNIKTDTTNKNNLLRGLRDHLINNSLMGRSVIIIVDEAQNLPDDTLEELRLLSNLETDKEKLLQIVLIGQNELRDRLLTDRFRQLNQRITLRANLRYLSLRETEDYINFRLAIAGKGSVTFSKKAMRLIGELSGGNPRLINLLCTRAMMAAYLDGVKEISTRHVSYAQRNLAEGLLGFKKRRTLSPTHYVLAAFFVVLIIAGVIYYLHRYSLFSVQEVAKIQNNTEKNEPTVSPPPQEQTIGQPPQDSPKGDEANKMDSSPEGNQNATEQTPVRIVRIKGVTNIRAKPDKQSLKVGVVTSDVVVQVIDDTLNPAGERWYKIRLQSGKEGWIRVSP